MLAAVQEIAAPRMPGLNQPAPDFKAPTTHGARTLADFKGKWLVLFSHPADFTPVGHTDESFSLVLDPRAPKAVFTGDVLLIRGTGRTDFQNGDPRKSWDSIVGKLFRLPEETLVYPAHYYPAQLPTSRASAW